MISSTPEVIYIGGYGRSGSTILDILLSQEQQIFGAGELFFLFDDWGNENRTCSCGQPYEKCPFWGDLSSEIDIEKAKNVIHQVEAASQLQNINEGLLPRSLRQDYETIQERLFAYIRRKSGCSVVIDSSKTKPEMAARPLALDRLTSNTVKMIHLTRSGRNTVKTIAQKGSNWSLEGHRTKKRLAGFTSVYGWKRANQLALRCQQILGHGRYAHVRYEDLQADPFSTLQVLGSQFSMRLDRAMECVQEQSPLEVGHRVGGNRIRYQQELVFKQDAEELNGLHPFSELGFQLIAGNLSRSLGYHR